MRLTVPSFSENEAVIYPPSRGERDTGVGGGMHDATETVTAPSSNSARGQQAVAPLEPMPAGYAIYKDCMGSCYCLCEQVNMPEIRVAKFCSQNFPYANFPFLSLALSSETRQLS